MKAKRIGIVAVTGLAVAFVTFSGIMKFMGGEQITASMRNVGVEDYRLLLGSMEVVFALLFLYPKTMKLGFILLSCYFAGALATELSHGTPFMALLPLTLVWISAFLRDRSIFLPSVQKADL